MIRHFVLARFAADTDTASVDAVFAELRELRSVVPGMLNFAGGPNVSPEGLGRGFSHAFSIDFVDAVARDVYLAHPAHQAAGGRLVALAQGGIEGILVFDLEIPAP